MGGGMHRHGRMDVREGKRQSDKVQNGYLTVGLSLCLAVLLSLCLTLIDGVRRNCSWMEIVCITDIGMHIIMAEYHR